VGQSVPYTSDQLAPEFQKVLYKGGCDGIFLQPDPIWDVNLYPYVGNNPENYIDPTGEFLQELLKAGAEALFEEHNKKYRDDKLAERQRLRETGKYNRKVITQKFEDCMNSRSTGDSSCGDAKSSDDCVKQYLKDLDEVVYPYEDYLRNNPYWLDPE